ncbi:olfactory receptor 52K1-like [Gastrophryne carolinensis]
MESWSHNQTFVSYTEFFLFGFPGIVCYRKVLIIPFILIYGTILSGNVLIIHQIFVHPSLHSPMYVFMSLLFAANVACSTTVLPKCILGLSFDMEMITLTGCLIQMFFMYFLGAFESSVMLMMALDRFLAICRPLRYNNIMTKKLMVQLALIGIVRSLFLAAPTALLTSRYHFCRSNIILNFVCENMGLLSLACDDISRMHFVGLIIKAVGTLTDVSLLLISYSSILYTTMKIIGGQARHKALHTCLTHIVVSLLIYTCSLLVSITYRIRTHISHDTKNLFTAIYLMGPASLNPFIYGAGMKEIRSCLTKSWRKNEANILI